MIRLTTQIHQSLYLSETAIAGLESMEDGTSIVYTAGFDFPVVEPVTEILAKIQEAKFTHPDNVDDTGRPIFTPPLENEDTNSSA